MVIIIMRERWGEGEGRGGRAQGKQRELNRIKSFFFFYEIKIRTQWCVVHAVC